MCCNAQVKTWVYNGSQMVVSVVEPWIGGVIACGGCGADPPPLVAAHPRSPGQARLKQARLRRGGHPRDREEKVGFQTSLDPPASTL